MNRFPLRLKITLWFSTVLIILVALTCGVILYINDFMIQKVIQDNLIEMVENDVDEIEYFPSIQDKENDYDLDVYLSFRNGYLEIDDDFLGKVNEISVAVYQENGSLLYGENPLSQELSDMKFSDLQIQTKNVNGVTWYIYDRKLVGSGLDGLWLRGVVSAQQGDTHFASIINFSLIFIPIFLILAILGGYFIARRSLAPIRKIATTASQIGQGRDLKKRIELGEGTDEIHQLADTFNAMFERLDSSFEAERQFTSDVSHELRTPMAVIMAQCEYLLEKQRSTEEYEDAIKLIQRQSKKMTNLITDMLAFARLEFQIDSFEMHKVNLTKLVSAVCEDMAQIQDKNITLTWKTDDDVFIAGNEHLLTRLLSNLIGNAYRYGKNNGYIFVELSESPEQVVLSVKDNGIGISSEDQKNIFQRFYRADKSRASKGTGIGLAMVNEIAELHKGTISVNSILGEGSTFLFIISKSPH